MLSTIHAVGRFCAKDPLSRSGPDSMSTATLPSRQWSCSELAAGAKFVADMSGMDLCYDTSEMSREQLLESIKDGEFTCE